MALPSTRDGREFDKFEENVAGETAVRTTGEYSPSGLRVGLRVTTMDVGDTAVAIPASAFASRNAISIYNKSTSQTIYINDINVTADNVLGTTSGWEIPPNGYFNVDITPDIIIYGRCESGQSARIKVLELA